MTTPFNNPFKELAAQRDALPAGKAPAPATGAPGPARAVLRLERKGRSGKEVTIIEQLDLKPAELNRWLKDLKHTLGCGGTIENGALLLQGDHRDRLPALLTSFGVKRLSIG